LAAHGRQILSTKLRFEAKSTFAGTTILDWMLAGACGCIGVSVNTVYCFATAVRLKRITIWPASQGEATVYWAADSGTLFSQPDVTEDRSLPTGITVTAPLSVTPPAGSPAHMWHVPNVSSGVTICDISMSQGSILDLEVDFTLPVNELPLAFAVATAVPGTAYYLSMDGSTAHQITPLGRPTTF